MLKTCLLQISMNQYFSFCPSLIIQSKSHLAHLNKGGPVESEPMWRQRNDTVAWQGQEISHIGTEEMRIFTEANRSHVSHWNEKHKKWEAEPNPEVLDWNWFQSISAYINQCIYVYFLDLSTESAREQWQPSSNKSI